jgi:hypothetical protein
LRIRKEHAPSERRSCAPRAAGDVEAGEPLEQRCPARGCGGLFARPSPPEELPRDRQRGRHLPWGEEPAVADLDES